MLRQVCKGKIHRATVTQADLNYMGSITLDSHLMRAANIWPFEMVQITNLSNGVIWHTYALEGLPAAERCASTAHRPGIFNRETWSSSSPWPM
ncbi:hypothetical protein GCM10025857_33590 [Alicyclobacillus contaminans]|nr:hypothetical protein GCM10025857_33590 [Alicyclobacillus contaminans]